MHPRQYVHTSLLISELIIFAILITIFVYGLCIYKKKEFVWIGSKILTIKEILKDNKNYNYPLKDIISDTSITTIDKNYDYLLTHSTKNDCEQNFKKCGILDTYGNIMCIPESDSCPINKITIDLEEKKNDYINKGYKYTKISKIPSNYVLYYTNIEIDNEIIVHLNFCDEQPKYISPQNFIFDNDTYDKFLVKHYSSGGDDGYYDGGGGGDYDGGGGYDGGGIGDGGGYWRRRIFETDELYGNSELTQYIYKKFEEKKNIDSYYKKIYHNIYVKNYIGFESIEKMNFIMNIDLLTLYLTMIPNYPSTIISIFCAIALIVLCIFSICRLNYKDVPNDHGDESCITFSKCFVGWLYFIIFAGYYIYFIYGYCKIYKNPKLMKIKKIKSDIFIEDFIIEISKGKNKDLILSVIILMSFSIIFFILTWIFKPLHQLYLKLSNNIEKNDLKENSTKRIKDFESYDEKIKEKKIIKDFENMNGQLNEKKEIKDFSQKDMKKEDIKKINKNYSFSTKNDESSNKNNIK